MGCDRAWDVGGRVNTGDILHFYDVGVRFEGIENHGGEDSAVVSVIGENCEVLEREKISDREIQEFDWRRIPTLLVKAEVFVSNPTIFVSKRNQPTQQSNP